MTKPRMLMLTQANRVAEQEGYHLFKSMVEPFLTALERQFDFYFEDDYRRVDEKIRVLKPDLIFIDAGFASLGVALPDPSKLCNIDAPIAMYISLDAHYHSHQLIIRFLRRVRVEAIFSHDLLADFYPDFCKRKHIFIPNTYNDNDFTFKDVQQDIVCGFYGAGFTDGNSYPWRRRVAAKVLPEFPSYVLPRPLGLRMHNNVGSRLAETIRRTKFCFGCTSLKDIPVKKVFEIPACGSLLMTNRSEMLAQLGFKDSVNCCFVDTNNVLQTIRFYLDHPDHYAAVTAAGREMVARLHRPESRKHVIKWFEQWSRKSSGEFIVQSTVMGEFATESSTTDTCSLVGRSQIATSLVEGRRAWSQAEYLYAAEFYTEVISYYPLLTEAIIGSIGSLLIIGQVERAGAILTNYFRVINARKAVVKSRQILCYYLALKRRGILVEGGEVYFINDPLLEVVEEPSLRKVISGLTKKIDHAEFGLTNTDIPELVFEQHLIKCFG